MKAKSRASAIDRIVAGQPIIKRAIVKRSHGAAPTLDLVAAAQLQDLLTLANQHLSARNKQLALNDEPLRARRVTEADIGILQKNIEITNHWINEGALALDRGTALVSRSPFIPQGKFLNIDQWEASIEISWYGWCLCINEPLLDAILLQLAAGAGLAGILAMLEMAGVVTSPLIIPTALAAAIIMVGAMVLSASSRGNGVCICSLWFPPGHTTVRPR